MLSFRDFLLESGLIQDLPPNYEVQTWMKENREIFHKKHGEEQGERILFARAWQTYNAINKRKSGNSD